MNNDKMFANWYYNLFYWQMVETNGQIADESL